LDLAADGARLAIAASALWHGRAEVDSLNRMVLRGGMSWEDVALLRAYHRYRNQVTAPFTTAYVADVLVENPQAARAIVDLFAARFDPRRDAVPDDVADIRRRVDETSEAVARLDHDRVLRSFAALVDATLRTNRYFGEGTHLALKFDSAAVPGVRRPIPFREIFVYGPKVEGVHLRWGPVARGGLRRSERPDDYRSEVLGLVRAQVLKNALIVPTGAKGGFVVKRGRYGAASGATDPREAYEIFVRSLLELTDNVVGGRVVPVATRQDGDDPYLVVAADSGTAGFSDLANQISMERGFWLGDAFASGGSHGYHHKRLGITARGAWVAVRHHFFELGIDIEAEPTTVVGIGDMSGDVFGNFMLRSDRLRLVAAFDHRDIFIDPDPDPERPYQERVRLFAQPSSSWQDYDRSAISPGGGVWSRLDKRITLSPHARTALGIEEPYLTPPDLIRAILQAPVNLLFAGGIGTFVRASTEPDPAVDDRANSEVRVEGSAIRARVVGEGANLAFTQRARIEFARRGGRINTDAIDNSAGVDISDHEVNLKILLRSAMEAGEITGEERDRILEEVCTEVVAAVLRDSSQQSIALSRAQATAAPLAGAMEVAMRELEVAGVLDRAVEVLPGTEEMRVRAEAGAGLTRPELAVVLAGAKRGLTAQLLASGLPDQAALRALLVSYFPSPLSNRFAHHLDTHRLRRELTALRMANEIVNRMGPTFVSRLAAETRSTPSSVAAAYWIAAGVAGADAYWRQLDGEGGETPAPAEAARTVSDLLESLTRSYLRRGEAGDIATSVARDRPAYVQVEAELADLGTTLQRRRVRRRAEALVDTGVEAPAARQWAGIATLAVVPDVAELARETAREVTGVAHALLVMSEALGVDRLLDRLHAATLTDRWSRAAWLGLVEDLAGLRRRAARRALTEHPDEEAVPAARRFLADRADAVHELSALIRDIERDPQAGLEAVTVAASAVRRTLA
ncbi:MAG: NAD-glutamate dehydrogenase domain-containing protein, partial [Acidimicrobiales bacterium]